MSSLTQTLSLPQTGSHCFWFSLVLCLKTVVQPSLFPLPPHFPLLPSLKRSRMLTLSTEEMSCEPAVLGSDAHANSAGDLQDSAQLHEEGQHSPTAAHCQIIRFIWNLLSFKCWPPTHIKKTKEKPTKTQHCGLDRTHVWASCATACQLPASKIDL